MRAFPYRGIGVALAAPALAALSIGAAEADRMRQRELFAVPGWVLPGASIDLDFEKGRYWQGGTPCRSPITCLTANRASTHYCSEAQGNFIAVGSNQPCVTNSGFLVEESRTNSVRNSVMSGAVPGTPGTIATDWTIGNAAGLTTSIVATGVDAHGINTMDIRFSGTSTGSFIAIFPDLSSSAIAATQGQLWTFSFFNSLVGGSLANVTAMEADIQEADSGGSVLASDVVSVALPTAAIQRASSGSVTLGNASAAFVRPRIGLQVNSGAALDFTVRIGWPQLERCTLSTACYASSPIPTNGAAATRAADVPLVTASIPGAPSGSITAFVSGMPNAPTSYGVTQTPLQLDGGTNQNRLDFDRNASNAIVAPGYATAGVGQTTASSSTAVAANASFKAAFAVATNDQGYAINSALTTYSGGNSTFVPSRVVLGRDGTGVHQFNGYITRVAVWPTQRLPNSLLQQLTQ